MATCIDNNIARPIDGSPTPANVVQQAPILSGGDIPRMSSAAVNFDCSDGDGATALISGKTNALVALPANAVITKLVVWQIDAWGAAIDFGWEDTTGSGTGSETNVEDALIDGFASSADTVRVSDGGTKASSTQEGSSGQMPPLGAEGGYLIMTAKGTLTAASKGQLYVEYIVFGGNGSN